MRNMTKILLAEDDINLGFVIQDHLVEAGYEVDLRKDGSAAFQAFYQKDYDLCILDVMLPKKDGFALAEDIRRINDSTPIIFLTAKSLQEDKVTGFRIGADDYITKPFDFEELLLRMEAVLKRSGGSVKDTEKKDFFQIGRFQFDYRNLILKMNEDESRNLTKKEAKLLRLLCIHQDKVLERDMALNLVWGQDDYFLGRSMDVFITKLRKYLKADPSIQIQNVHGVGFKLVITE